MLADLKSAERKKARGEKPQAVCPKALEAVRLIDACSPSSAPSMALRPRSGWPFVRLKARRSSPNLKPGWPIPAASSPAAMTWPRGSTISRRVGRRSRASWTMVASAYPTMPPSVRCVASRSGANPGCSAARTVAVSAPPSCTASSSPPR